MRVFRHQVSTLLTEDLPRRKGDAARSRNRWLAPWSWVGVGAMLVASVGGCGESASEGGSGAAGGLGGSGGTMTDGGGHAGQPSGGAGGTAGAGGTGGSAAAGSGGSSGAGGSGGASGAGGASGVGGTGGGAGGSGAGGAAPLVETTVWLVGDSTVASGSGWGDSLQPLLDDKATVINRARGGRSSKSFYEEDNNAWTEHPDAVMRHITEGDYVMIQFGHNDEKDDVDRHTEPGSPPDYQDTFREYLERYINETRGVGATPILITPVSRMTFHSDGSHARTHGDYPAAMKQTAVANGVVLLDLEEQSHERFDALGEAQTLELFSDGEDRSHFPPEKAWRVADMVAALLQESGSPLRAYLK